MTFARGRFKIKETGQKGIRRGKGAAAVSGESVSLEDVLRVREMERLLDEFPGVAESAVLVQEMPGGEKNFIAFVQPEKGCALDKEKLAAFFLERTKITLRVEVCDLPKTPTGKVARHLLRAASGE